MGTISKGFAAGVWGTLAMAGVGITIRRLTSESDDLGKNDPEETIDWIFRTAGRSEPPPRTRRRLADPLHFLLVGGIGGAVYAALTQGRDRSPWRGGLSVAATMWVAGFCGYLPALGVLPYPWKWSFRKLQITTSAHLAYGWTMALLYRQFTADDRPV